MDAELAKIQNEEISIEVELEELSKYHSTIEREEAKYWDDFNLYEK